MSIKPFKNSYYSLESI